MIGPRAKTGLTLSALIGVVLVFYAELWRHGLVLMKRDAFRFFPPLKEYMVERLSAGELPEWFPYDGLGRSFIGVTHTGVFHPFTLLYFAMSPFDALRISTLASCLLAALGAFALGRSLNISRMGSLAAGASFVLSGYVVSMTDNMLYLYSICLLPLFCLALERAFDRGGGWIAGAAALWASVFLNGDAQTGYYYGLIALLWMGLRAPGTIRQAGLRLAAVCGLTVLLAGVQLGPAWAVFAASERAHPLLFEAQAFDWSTHPLRLVTVLAAPIGADADPAVLARSFFGIPTGGFWAESLYLGIPMSGLALLGMRYRRDLSVLGILGGLALLLALGRFGLLYNAFYHVLPMWSAFRYPEKFMGIVTFAAAMLAGAGIDALRTRRSSPASWLAVAALCLAAAAGFRLDAASAATASHFAIGDALARSVTESAAAAFLWSAAAAGGAGLVVFALRRVALREMLLVGVFAAILILDLARVNLDACHTGPAESAFVPVPLAEALKAREGQPATGRFRMISLYEDVLVWPRELMAPVGYHGAASIARLQALDHEHNARFGLESALPYLSGHSVQFAETLNPRSGVEAAARLNVAYYVGRRYHLKNPHLARGLVAELPAFDLALFRNPVPPKPRAYLSLHPESSPSPVNPAKLYERPDFLDGTVDVIETTARTLPAATGGRAAIERYLPEEVRVRVETPTPGTLILLDAYENGWTAEVDGAETPIMRANALVRAVSVPAGTHVVTFTYRTPLLYAGAAASLAGLILSLGLLAHAWVREGRLRGLLPLQ